MTREESQRFMMFFLFLFGVRGLQDVYLSGICIIVFTQQHLLNLQYWSKV